MAEKLSVYRTSRMKGALRYSLLRLSELPELQPPEEAEETEEEEQLGFDDLTLPEEAP